MKGAEIRGRESELEIWLEFKNILYMKMNVRLKTVSGEAEGFEQEINKSEIGFGKPLEMRLAAQCFLVIRHHKMCSHDSFNRALILVLVTIMKVVSGRYLC